MTSALPHTAITVLVLLLMLASIVLTIPGRTLARCFGVPEKPPVVPGAGWYANLTLIAALGGSDGATFGAAEGATDFYDREVDVLENYPSNRTVSLYFVLDAFPTGRGDGFATVDANVSVNNGAEPETIWPLFLEYRGDFPQPFVLTWNASEVAAVPASWSLTIRLPGLDPIDMRTRSEVRLFFLDPGIHVAFIVGKNTPGPSSSGLSSEALVSAGAIYVLLVGLVLVLRAYRRKRRSAQGDRERGGRRGDDLAR